MNPLVPSPADFAGATLVTIHVTLMTVALIALVMSPTVVRRRSAAAVIVLVPIAGPVLALVAVWRARHLRTADADVSGPQTTRK